MNQKQTLFRTGDPIHCNERYAPCLRCQRHPHYPQPPITLHRGDQCLICMTSKNNLAGNMASVDAVCDYRYTDSEARYTIIPRINFKGTELLP